MGEYSVEKGREEVKSLDGGLPDWASHVILCHGASSETEDKRREEYRYKE